MLVEGEVHSRIALFESSSVVESEVGYSVGISPAQHRVVGVVAAEEKVVWEVEFGEVEQFGFEGEGEDCFVLPFDLLGFRESNVYV